MLQQFLVSSSFFTDDISASELRDGLVKVSNGVEWSVKELTDNDFVEEDIEPNVVKKRIRGPLNLRRHNENKLKIYDICIVDGLDHSPKMMVEHIAEADDPDNKEKKIPSASCIWFVNNELQRQVFKIDCLKKYVKEEKAVNNSNLPDSIMNGCSLNTLAKDHLDFRNYMFEERKIDAIKVAREITGMGLKEAKDFVESVTPTMLSNWQKGYF